MLVTTEDFIRKPKMYYINLISPKNIPCVNLVLHIIKNGVVAVGYNGLGLGLEVIEVVYNPAAKEGGAVLEGRFIYYYLGSFCFYTFHYALNRTLAEVVGI